MASTRTGSDAPVTLPLLEAKLAPPRTRAGVVARARLFAALDAPAAELVVVSGPAGSGKTMLVSSWLEANPDLARAWVTLDAGDEDPVRLWTHVAEAVDRVRPGIARPALRLLRTPRSRVEASVDELLNGLSGYDGRLTIVLDDLHHLRGERSLRSVVYAADRLPDGIRIIATTRSDPGPRLSRLRTRRALGEIRARDLAFTIAEATELLVGLARIPVGREDVELLVDRTEGWAAGISLAALWLATSAAPADEIRQFTADHRHVTDYLTSEVLDSLDERTRGFLVATSILDRLTAPLCDAVLDTDDAAEILHEIERSNLFLVALDSRRVWYRYHHLFREFLRIDLATLSPELSPELHRRAADWFLEHGLIEEALEHAAVVGDSALATMLVQTQMTLLRSGEFDLLMASIERLSEAELARRPILAALGAMAAGMLGQPAAKSRRLAALADDRGASLPEPAQSFLRVILALTYGALLDTDLDAALEYGTTAAELARSHADELAVSTIASLAYTHYLRGETETARELATEVVMRPDAPQRPHGFVHAEALLALVECDAGHPRAGETRARRAVAEARDLGLSGAWSAALAHHALGQAHLALGHAHDAERELERAETLRRRPEPRLHHAHTLLALAAARIARGRLALAASELDAAREELDSFHEVGRLGAFATEVGQRLDDARAGSDTAIEVPTLAELSVLRMLAGDLTQRGIGSELFLSVNTVKTHTRSLYVKLGVNSREAAVERAYALALIEPGDSPG